MSNTTIASHLKEEWSDLSAEERVKIFTSLPRGEAEDLFTILSSEQQAMLISLLPISEKRSWLRFLPPDDVVDLLQILDQPERDEALGLIDDATRQVVNGLLAYAEDEAGGLMNPLYIRLRPDMTVGEAILYTRAQARTPVETIYYTYVLNAT
ncbi:MAG TPA: magnesium transporter, partial [Myxococcota bacterium]|nr:magnesium transporter [Myxococcota bacterium]